MAKNVKISPVKLPNSGKEVWQIALTEDFINGIISRSRRWEESFRKYVDKDNLYPYVLSPSASQLVPQAFDQAVTEFRAKYNWEVKRWFGERESSVLGVMRRVIIPDTYEPIFHNTGKMAGYIKGIGNDSTQTIRVRSFFTGAGVAERSLLIQLYKLGIKGISLITTDYSAESQILAVINLQLWNLTLPIQDWYDVYLVSGNAPEELYTRRNTIVFQIGDALYAIKSDYALWKNSNDYRIDALLLDNALPYVPRDFGKELLDTVIQLRGLNGVYISILGLAKNLKVEINTIFQLSQIFRGDCEKGFTDILKVGGFTTNYGYKHRYEWEKVGDIALISRVISLGAAHIYDWLHDLLFSLKFKQFSELLSAIKSATSLSKAGKMIKTSPEETHEDLLRLAADREYAISVYADPSVTEGDPVVLRITLAHIAQ